MVITTSIFLKDATAYSIDTFSYLLDTCTHSLEIIIY